VEGREVRLGNAALLAEAGVSAGSLADLAETMRQHGQTVVFLSVEGALAGLLAVADPVKPSSVEAVRLLRARRLGRATMRNIRQNCSSPSSTPRRASRSRRERSTRCSGCC
jgi:cation transport ATPase